METSTSPPSPRDALAALRAEQAPRCTLGEGALPWDDALWHEALAHAEPLPSVRALELRVLPWSSATFARLAAVFPCVETLHADAGARVGDAPCYTEEDLLELLWALPSLRDVEAQYLPHREADARVTGAPACAATLERLVLHGFRVWRLEPLHAAAWPRLRELELYFEPRKREVLRLAAPALESLSVHLAKGSRTKPFRLEGELPALRSLRLSGGELRWDPASLRALALPSLRELTLYASDAWSAALDFGRALEPTAQRPLLRVDYDASHGSAEERLAPEDPRREADWAALQWLLARGFALSPEGCLAQAESRERFLALEPVLRGAEKLQLGSDLHGYLLREPELLRACPRVRTVRLFDATACTTEALEGLCAALPALETLVLLNNHNPAMEHLRLSSPSLRSLTLTHFHALRSVTLDCPALEDLELDNCDGEDLDKHPDSKSAVDGCRCYGNLGERVLRALLDGAPELRLPALRSLSLWHNHNSYGGPPPTYEALRVDVPCAVGHPALEKLVVSYCVHLRSLRLAKLPALREVCVRDHPREEGEAGFFEALECVDLDPACVVEADGPFAPSVGLPLP